MTSRRSIPGGSASNHDIIDTETKSWNGKTFQLPKSLPSSQAPPHEKNKYFTRTLQGLDSASSADVLTKLNVLESRFEFSNLLSEISASLKVLLDTTSGLESPPIILTPNTVFVLTEPSVRSQGSGELQFPSDDAIAEHVRNFRKKAMFYTFQLEVDTQQAYTGEADIAVRSQLLSQTFTATIRLPRREPIRGEADFGQRITTIHPSLTTDILRSPTNTIRTIIDITGQHPVLGSLKKNSGEVSATHDPDSFRASYMTMFNKTRYSLYRTLLKQEYIGDALIPESSLTTELQKVQQRQFDVNHKPVYSTVEQYYTRFNYALTMFGNGKPYPLDVANTFWIGLLPSIRDAASSENYSLPVSVEPASIQQATQRLRTVKESAVGFEKKVTQLEATVTRVTGSRSNGSYRNGTRSFFAGPTNNEDHTPDNYDNDNHESYAEAYSAAPSYAGGTTDLSFIPDPADLSEDTICLAASVYLSAYLSSAELALQTATGSSFPPLECWGCKGHPTRHDTRFHRWSSCTHRGDRVAQDNAKKGFQKFMEDRQDRQKRQESGQQRSWGSPYAPHASKSTVSVAWKDDGFPSQHAAELVYQIADPNTYPGARKLCFQALSQQEKQVSWSENSSSRKSPRNNESTTPASASVNGIVHLHFIPSSPVPVMATQFGSRAHLSISQQMPHVRFPVGDSNTATVHSMVDTCAGLNLGRLPYHLSIYKTCPHLVESFVYLKDVDYLDEFSIGGVDEHGNETKVTAVITYKTPFRMSGQAVSVSFGLSESASTNTIIGLPFLRATRSAMIMTGDDEEVLICQRLGTTFRVDYQVPHRSNQAPKMAQDTHASFPYFVDMPTAVTEELERLVTSVSLGLPQTTEENDNAWTMNFDFPDVE
jgi:hypothetical protein